MTELPTVIGLDELGLVWSDGQRRTQAQAVSLLQAFLRQQEQQEPGCDCGHDHTESDREHRT